MPIDWSKNEEKKEELCLFYFAGISHVYSFHYHSNSLCNIPKCI